MIERIALTASEIEAHPEFDLLMQLVEAGSLEIEVVESDTGRRQALLVASTTIAMIDSVINRLS